MEFLRAAKDNIEASATPVAAMSAPHRSDAPGMPGRGQPIVNRGPNSTPFERRLALAFVAGNQQDHALSRRDGTLECPVDRLPCPVEVMAMEIKDAVGLQLA